MDVKNNDRRIQISNTPPELQDFVGSSGVIRPVQASRSQISTENQFELSYTHFGKTCTAINTFTPPSFFKAKQDERSEAEMHKLLVGYPIGQPIWLVETREQFEQIWKTTELSTVEVLSLDAEWVSSGDKKGSLPPISMLQLGTFHCTVLLRMCKLITAYNGVWPDELKSLLSDEKVFKVGVGILGDAAKLKNDHNLELKGCADLALLAHKYMPSPSRKADVGLADLAEELADMILDKSLHLRCGNWERDSLLPELQEYAARDVQTGFTILLRIFKHVYGPLGTEYVEGCYVIFMKKIKKLITEFLDELDQNVKQDAIKKKNPQAVKKGMKDESVQQIQVQTAKGEDAYHTVPFKDAKDLVSYGVCDLIRKGAKKDQGSLRLKLRPINLLSTVPAQAPFPMDSILGSHCFKCYNDSVERLVQRKILPVRYSTLMGETVYAEIIKCYPSLLGAVTLCLSCYSESDRFDERQDRMLCSAQISNLDDKRNDIVSKTTSLDMRIEAVRKNALAYLRMEKEGNKDDNEYPKSERTVCDYFGVPLLHKEVAKFAAELKSAPCNIIHCNLNMDRLSIMKLCKTYEEYYSNWTKAEQCQDNWSESYEF